MTNTREITDSLAEVHIEIDNGDGSFTCMLKANYETQLAQQVEHLTEIASQAALSTPIVSSDAN